MAFTPFWEDTLKWMGITKPTGFLPHGFNPLTHYPVPTKICRDYYNLKHDDFIVLSLNRNQPRKRYDLLLKAWAEFVYRHQNDPVKLLIATAIKGSWDLMEVYTYELKLRGLTIEDGLKHVIFIDNPQNLLDEEINILYNLGDISLAVSDGGGFELCTYQQAALGKPQITSYVGGIKDFFTAQNSVILKPTMKIHLDSASVGGEAELIDYLDAVDGLEAYYANSELCKRHGALCREGILKKYKWSDIGEKLYNIIKEVDGSNAAMLTPPPTPAPPTPAPPVSVTPAPTPAPTPTPAPPTPAPHTPATQKVSLSDISDALAPQVVDIVGDTFAPTPAIVKHKIEVEEIEDEDVPAFDIQKLKKKTKSRQDDTPPPPYQPPTPGIAPLSSQAFIQIPSPPAPAPPAPEEDDEDDISVEEIMKLQLKLAKLLKNKK
jgi:hypothetical protein